MPGRNDTEVVRSHSDDALTEMADTSSSDDDDAFAWTPGVNTLTSFDLVPKGGDYRVFKNQLQCDLRIGSAYHIGSRDFPISATSDSHERSDSTNNSSTDAHLSGAFLRHPLQLIMAREEGSIGPSSKPKSLMYKATRWHVEGSPRIDGLQFYGNRSRGAVYADPQTFQESIRGSLWAVSRLHLEDKFKCHRGCVNALCFNSAGDLIASGSDDLKVVVTDWKARKQVAKYETGHCMNIFHVKFLPETNDTKLVSCACDSEVRLAELATDGSLVGHTRLLVSHNRSCHKLSLPHGEPYTVLSAGADGQVFSIDVRVPKADNILWLPSSEFFSIASHPIRPYEVALCGRSESIVRIYDRRRMTGRDPKSGYLHCFGAEHLRPTTGRTTSRVASQSADTPIDGSTASVPHAVHSDSDSDLGDSDTTGFLGSLSSQLGRRVRELLNGIREQAEVAFRFRDGRRQSVSNHPPYKLESSRYSVTAAVYTNQGDALLASYNDEDIYLFDTRSPNKPYLHKYSGHRNMQTIVSATFFGPNSEYVVSGSDDGFFYVWDRESEGIVQWLHADADGAVNVIESHPTLPILASAGLDYDFKIWSPLRSILHVDDDDDDDLYSAHLKYTSDKIPPSVRQLRRSRLAKALFADVEDPVVPATPMDAEPSSEPAISPAQSPLSTDSSDSFQHATTQIPVTVHNLHLSDSPSACVDADVDHVSRRVSKRRHSSSSDCTDPGTIDRPEDQCLSTEVSQFSDTESRLSKKHRKRSISPKSSQPCSMSVADADCTTSGVSKPNTISDRSGLTSVPAPPPPPPPPAQSLLPFNLKDLQLRVAQNWINRTYERDELDSLEEADSRILSAIESVARLHSRAPRRREARRDISLSSDTDDSSPGGSGIMGSFVFLRGPTEASGGTSRETENRLVESSDINPSVHGTSSSSSSSSSCQAAQMDSDQNHCSSTSTTSTSNSLSPRTDFSSSSSTTSSQSHDNEILELLELQSPGYPLNPVNSHTSADDDPDDVE